MTEGFVSAPGNERQDAQEPGYVNKPQRMVFENGEFSVKVEANCDDLAFAEIVLAIMEMIGRPRLILETPR